MDKFDEKLGRGYNKNEICLIVVSPETLFAYWEISKKTQEQAKAALADRKNSLILRLLDNRDLPIFSAGINDFLGSYYLKREYGIMPDSRYCAEIGIQGEYYLKLAGKSNIVITPRNCESNDSSCEFYDPIKEALERERLTKGEKRRSLEFIRKADEQIKKDRKSSDFIHNYFIK
ncbi:MAG: DUF4912 domain-containing protein [archaeon]